MKRTQCPQCQQRRWINVRGNSAEDGEGDAKGGAKACIIVGRNCPQTACTYSNVSRQTPGMHEQCEIYSMASASSLDYSLSHLPTPSRMTCHAPLCAAAPHSPPPTLPER